MGSDFRCSLLILLCCAGSTDVVVPVSLGFGGMVALALVIGILIVARAKRAALKTAPISVRLNAMMQLENSINHALMRSVFVCLLARHSRL